MIGMWNPLILVEAVGERISSGRFDPAYVFKVGEKGILKWVNHPTEIGFWKPMVLWDGDSGQRYREVSLANLRIIGIEHLDRRVILDLQMRNQTGVAA
jgi:hypothetical protein